MIKTILLIGILSAFSGQTPIKGLVWENWEHDFGNVREGEVVSTDFKFYNYSDSVFKIENVQTSCGCTASEWPHEAIQPGDSGIVRVSFDSEGKRRKYEKVIAVYSTHGLYELLIKVNVIKP